MPKRLERRRDVIVLRRMAEDSIEKMRARVEQCRRLAATITDPRAAAILRKMADDGQADIARLEAERREGKKPTESNE